MVRSPDLRHFRRIPLGTALVLTLSTAPAFADFPGERWNIGFVKVSGTDQAAVRSGLQRAAEIYFYGDETEARMEADVSDAGSFDVRIVGPGGSVLAEQRGLSYAPGGGASNSATQAALAWLDGLACGDGCAVAEARPAPAPAPAESEPAVAIAQAAVEAVQSEPADETPVVADAAPETDEPASVEVLPPVTTPEITVAEVPAPSAPASTEPVEIAVASPEPPLSEGIDADLVLRQERARNAPQADQSAEVQPETEAAASAPSQPAARQIETPAVADAPSAGSSSDTSVSTVADEQAPSIAAAPAPTEDVQPVEVETPSSGASDASAVSTAADQTAPNVAPQPTVAEVVEPATPAVVSEEPAETSTAAGSASASQEVAPGITLPSPDASVTPSEVTEIATGSSTQEVTEPAETPQISSVVPAPTPVPTEIPSPTPSSDASETTETATAQDDGDSEQLALVNPQREVTPLPTQPAADDDVVPAPASTDETSPAEAAASGETDDTTTVETRIAAVDPTADGPTLANARWVGFTPAVFTGSDNKPGAWISGPFDRKQRTGWITDTATGATTRVTFIWRDGGSGSRTALLSRDAAKALGLGQGDVANVAVYLPR
ncbi:MAG: hypothetical protein AAGD13_04760 [Pseudomonadota bacterium]